ncbi:hypothetical protein scyTo_0006674 [Scyliorhinus torazame]|uniref:Uncharacterized protein n=1 Tax=Scyliorhinus torazame TaxID=75743 RepID=A0A401PJA7_SCYTO|nr:hypothetical protein [Scyliorhinus torazame]
MPSNGKNKGNLESTHIPYVPLHCWLSLDGGLLYAFVGPAAIIVLVNMLIGIIVFNKLMSRDGISDKSKKQRAGQASEARSGLMLKCSKCGVVSTTALSATITSNAMLVSSI